MSVLHQLIEQHILTPTPDNRFHCGCGSTLSKHSIRTHVKTKKHTRYMETTHTRPPSPTPSTLPSNVCAICILPPRRSYTCRTCGNTHCMTCHRRIEKCPFCRAEFIREKDPLFLQVKETLARIRERHYSRPQLRQTAERDYQFLVETFFEWTTQNKFRLRRYAPLQRGMQIALEFIYA